MRYLEGNKLKLNGHIYISAFITFNDGFHQDGHQVTINFNVSISSLCCGEIIFVLVRHIIINNNAYSMTQITIPIYEL